MKNKNIDAKTVSNVTPPPQDSSSVKKKRKKWPIILVIVVILIAAGVFGSGDDEPTSSDPSASLTESAQKSETKETKPDVPREYQSALSKAEDYSDMMHMSKAAIYDQLTSEYGEQFSKEAAQYAIDNLKADYKKNALEKAKQYQDGMDMSPAAIKDQLVSDYGEQFTQEEADYAIEHLND